MWQTASDFLIFLGWAWQNVTTILGQIFSPIQYIYTFLKEFFLNASAPPIEPEQIWTFPAEIIAIFNAVPYWNTIIYVALLGLVILLVVFVLKTFLKT